jgi:hypothetical protein
MRRDHRNRAHAVVLNAAGVDRGDRGAVGMPEQQTAAKADPVEHFRQDIERFDRHVIERTRQCHRRRSAIAGARIHEHAGTRGGLKFFGKIAPQPGRSEALVQHDDGRRVFRRRTDHAVFEIGCADAQGAGGCESGHMSAFMSAFEIDHDVTSPPSSSRPPSRDP